MSTSNKVKYCTGWRGCKQPIFTGAEYKKLRRGKCLCKQCYNKIKLSER